MSLAPACTSRSKARSQAREAFLAGQNQALRHTQNQPPIVTVIGEVRHHLIPWEEGLTLAVAIDAAGYSGLSDPRVIFLTRGTEREEIRVADLLQGMVNPELEPGDMIELRR
jgi:hypothetical protein